MSIGTGTGGRAIAFDQAAWRPAQAVIEPQMNADGREWDKWLDLRSSAVPYFYPQLYPFQRRQT
jgi:hypothetical protein